MVNLEQGKELAQRQDKVFKRLENGDPISDTDKKMLRENLWVKTACVLAPSNLTIRHYILLDLIKNKKRYYYKIMEMVCKLAPDLWAEGYSYWRYTRSFLELYAKAFKLGVLQRRINRVELYFNRTSYFRDGIKYPAPFGDLRDEPLDSKTLKSNNRYAKYSNFVLLRKVDNRYIVYPYMLGFNTHTPDKESYHVIADGYPSDFEFYTGYENKYNSKKEELKDTFNLRRFISIFRKEIEE